MFFPISSFLVNTYIDILLQEPGILTPVSVACRLAVPGIRRPVYKASVRVALSPAPPGDKASVHDDTIVIVEGGQ